MTEIYDLAILGAGPAGISAAVYAARARLKTLWLEKKFTQGGQIVNTYEVDNYPAKPGISGMDLGMEMIRLLQGPQQAERIREAIQYDR